MIVFSGSRLKATDVNGNTQNISIVGAESDTLKIGDFDSAFLLSKILKELRIMNLYLSHMTDIAIERSDIEETG